MEEEPKLMEVSQEEEGRTHLYLNVHKLTRRVKEE